MDWVQDNIIWLAIGIVVLIAVIRTVMGKEDDPYAGRGRSDRGAAGDGDGGGYGGGGD